MATQELLLAGNVLYRTFNPATGWEAGWEKAEVDKLAIQTPSELIRRISNGRDTYGQAVGGITVPQPTKFSITFAAASIEMMRLKLAGITEEINIAAGTFADLAVTVVPDKWVEIGKENIAAVGFTVKNTAGTVTYDLGTHYEINWRLGLIKALSTGPIAAGPVNLTGTHNAIAGKRIKGAKRYRNLLEFKLDGINLDNGDPIYLHAFRAAVASDSEHDFMAKGLATVPLTGELEVPEGRDAPFFLEYPEL